MLHIESHEIYRLQWSHSENDFQQYYDIHNSYP